MEFNISDEKLEQIIEKEAARYVAARIERVMNDGKAYWFSQQNIENLTRDIIARKIIFDSVDQIYDLLKTEEFLRRISDCIVGHLKDSMYE